MYKIDRPTNSIKPLKKVQFKDLGFKERAHLQEWIAKEPSALGEELLIIQKEFAGFSDTNERLDLLALDKQGCLVVIENKLDDTGRDVTWQALKYASYCSALSKDEIRAVFQQYLDKIGGGQSAEKELSSFYEDVDYPDLSLNIGVRQRIILVAANFRKEVTSTVLWLSNFQVRIKCFSATPYAMGDDLFLNVEQIIPTRDVESYTIRLAAKVKDEITGLETEVRRHTIRRAFWAEVIKSMNSSTSNLYQNISAGKTSWISASSGVRGLQFNFVSTKDFTRVELYIDRGEPDENKAIFDALLQDRHDIEEAFGDVLIWEPLDARRACRIKFERVANIYDQQQWPSMVDFLVEAMVRLEPVLRPRLAKLVANLSTN